MYSVKIWFITEDNTIDYLQSNSPKHTKSVLESGAGRYSLDIQEIGNVLVNLKS
jgi:hypothetical protein